MSMQFPLKKNYLALIRNAAQGKNYLFRNLYMNADGAVKDILGDGNRSCAVFVASILYLENSIAGEKLIDSVHATVSGTLRDLERNHWYEIFSPRPGAILVWEDKLFKESGETHSHIGFYLRRNIAVSNNTERGFPAEHHFTYGTVKGKPVRKIVKMYWHPALDR